MRVAILPPCYYPPRAYFELIREVDLCIMHTDLQYAKRKWTNRTVIRDSHLLTVPVNRPPRRTLMPIHKMTALPAEVWLPVHVMQMFEVYGQKVIENHPVLVDLKKLPETVGDNLAHMLYKTTKSVMKYYNLGTPLSDSREFRVPRSIQGQDRIIEICKRVGATEYVNPPSEHRYDDVAFARHGIRLKFFESAPKWSTLSILHDAFTWWM